MVRTQFSFSTPPFCIKFCRNPWIDKTFLIVDVVDFCELILFGICSYISILLEVWINHIILCSNVFIYALGINIFIMKICLKTLHHKNSMTGVRLQRAHDCINDRISIKNREPYIIVGIQSRSTYCFNVN